MPTCECNAVQQSHEIAAVIRYTATNILHPWFQWVHIEGQKLPAWHNMDISESDTSCLLTNKLIILVIHCA